MDAFDGSSLMEWTGWVTPGVVLAAVVACLLAGLAWLRRQRRGADESIEPETDFADRLAATAPISEEQVTLLRYLQEAFPDGAVLFRPRLSRFLRVRAGGDRSAARRWLAAMKVDFLLCDQVGTPLVAFEIDLQRARSDPNAQRRLDNLRLALRSTGIRMIRFKGALATWPDPQVLRERVLAEAAMAPSGIRGGGPVLSTFEHSHQESLWFGSSRPGVSRLDEVDSTAMPDPVSSRQTSVWAEVGKRS